MSSKQQKPIPTPTLLSLSLSLSSLWEREVAMSPQASSPVAAATTTTTTITSEQSAATILQDQPANTTNNSESEIGTTTTAATAAATTNNNGSALDSQLMMSLMERLQRYPSLLNTNSFLSQPLEDLFLSLPDEDEDEDDEDDDEDDGEGDNEVSADYRTRLAKEEAKLERELIRIIQSGKAAETLKPNSGQAVTVRDSHICVGFHEEPRQGYRVWEWHGHVLLYDEVQEYSPEYIYGNYFEKMAAAPKDDRFEEKDNPFASSGLRELIDSGGALNGRIVRRNMNSGGKR